MKKIIIAVAAVALAVSAQAVAIGWTAMGLGSYKTDKYLFCINGQNGASIAAVTALLAEGKSADALAFGSGTVNAGGMIGVGASTSGKSLDAGSYTGFFVLFDSASPVAGTTKYAVISGAANLTQTFAGTAASATFAAGNVNTSALTWEVYGAPEPTTGVLMLLGFAGLALRRRRA